MVERTQTSSAALQCIIVTPEMTDRVTAAMADKYWTQADFIVRRINHPYTMRLEPEPEG